MSEIPPINENPFAEPPYVPPHTLEKQAQWEQTGDGTGGVIPYKNPPALIGYYLGVFSLIPCFGFFLAVPALILGIVGLRNYSRNPVVKGQVHAWIAIIAGGLFTLVWGAALVFVLMGIVFGMSAHSVHP